MELKRNIIIIILTILFITQRIRAICKTKYNLTTCASVTQNKCLHHKNTPIITITQSRKAESWAFSPVSTTKLARVEMKLHYFALEYLNVLNERLEEIDRWLQDYEESAIPYVNPNDSFDFLDDDADLEWENARRISGNPLRTFRMMLRFAFNLENILYQIQSTSSPAFFKEFQFWNQQFFLPTPEDVLNVSDSIIRLQNVYDLPARNLMNGIIGNIETAVGLTPNQAFSIGKHAFTLGMYPEALDWFETVRDEIKIKPDYNGNVEFHDVIHHIRQLVEQHDALHDTINDENFYNLNMNRFHSKLISEYQRETEKSNQIKYFRDSGKLLDHQVFELLCNGDNLQSDAIKSQLYCWYDSRSLPSWYLNPLKMEMLSHEPFLIQIYDVIGDELIEYIKQKAEPQLERSMVINGESLHKYAEEVNNYRTSTNNFLSEFDHPPLGKMERMIGMITGLQVENTINKANNDYYASEMIQISAYSFGGHFSEHHDAIERGMNETKSGDRFATFMLYLNDVELGGGTAFPIIGRTVFPVKGSAIFWYDLFKNGEIDYRSLHGGCPVLLGQKWVATKWILYNANFQKKRCSVNPLA